MVGGRAYARSQFNRAVSAQRQPGSAFKPLVFLAALENGLKPDDRFIDAPFSVGDWTPKNYNDEYRGNVTAQQALIYSLNTVATQISEATGREKVIAIAERLGITSPLRPHPSLALGSFEVNLLELTSAYAHFANGGFQTIPYVISNVVTATGDVLYERQLAKPLRVVGKRQCGGDECHVACRDSGWHGSARGHKWLADWRQNRHIAKLARCLVCRLYGRAGGWRLGRQ